jgi:PilZ domain-containing protein
VERRQHPRIAKRFEGTWQGASGATGCSVSDVSIGGCYVHSLPTPAVGDETIVTIDFGLGRTLSLAGQVVYVEPGMGFGFRFHDLTAEEMTRLRQRLDELQASS